MNATLLGAALVTGNNSTFSGAGDWKNSGLGTFNVNSTVAGKMYMLGNGGLDGCYISGVLTSGLRYKITLKARLNAGSSTTIKVGSTFNPLLTSNYFEITPTGTEQTFSGYIIANAVALSIGINEGFNGVAFEVDDVDVRQIK